jgi:hypothetical protein
MTFRPGELKIVRWLDECPPVHLALALGAVVALVKLPLLFTTIGEHDQGRLILDAVVYASDGPETLRRYGLYTSPLWTLAMALLTRIIGPASLVLVSNLGGWMCGGLLSAFSFLLVREMGASRGWSAAAAVAVAFVPGTFYMSLYGYPSQFALPLLVCSAWAIARACDSGRHVYAWLAVSAAAYTLLTLTKIDFGLAGTFLAGVVVARACWKGRVLAALPLAAVAAAAAALVVTRVAIDARNVELFLRDVGGYYAWDARQVFEAPAATVLYSCGFGTLGLFVVAGVGALWRRDSRVEALRLLAAWALGALPLWIFWMGRPPMSSRHAVPGVVVTVLVAAVLGHRAFKWRRGPVVWVLLVVGANWWFGQPSHDFNYRPSGNLVETLRVNRRAFAVAEGIARDVVRRNESDKVLMGKRRDDVLYGIDLLPFVEVAMAQKSKRVSALGNGWPLEFTDARGRITRTHPNTSLSAALRYPTRSTTYYALYGDDLTPLKRQGKRVVSFDPDARLANSRP